MGTLKTLTKTITNAAITPLAYAKGMANETAERIENTENATLIALRDRKIKEQWEAGRDTGYEHAKWVNDHIADGIDATYDAIVDIIADGEPTAKQDPVVVKRSRITGATQA